METPKSAFRSSTGEQSRRRIYFGSKQLSEDSGLCIDSPWASSTPDCGVRKGSTVVASPKCYRRQERRSCFDWCYFLLWFCGIVAVIVLVGMLTAISWKKFPEVPAVAMLKQNVIPGVICVAGFIIFAGLVGMLGTHRLSNRAEESSMEFMHEDMDSAGQELKKKRSDTMNVHNLSPGSVEYRGPEEKDSCSQKKDNESVNTTSMLAGQKLSAHDYPVRRTFGGATSEVWSEFIQYFENISELNNWEAEKSRRVLLSTFRGQAEAYAYGLPPVFQKSYDRLKLKMDERFGHTAMKERYIAEANLRQKQTTESFRDFGQALEDLYRRAYPNNPEILQESAIKTFLNKCGQSEDFRLAVKRTKPKTLQEAVTSAMQEDCLRIGEKGLLQESRYVRRTVLGLDGKNLSEESAGSKLPARRQGNYHYNRGGFDVRSARYTKP